MRKTSNPNAIQLSLFDFISETTEPKNESTLEKEFKNVISSINQNKNLNHERDNTANDGQQGQQVPDSGERGHDTQEPADLEGTSALRNAAIPTAGTFSADEREENADPLPTKDRQSVLQPDGQMHGARDASARSGRGELEDTRGSSGALDTENKTPSITNFHLTENPSSDKSFSKKSRLQDNLNALNALTTLQEENRLPDENEKLLLAKYVGWGGLKQILLDPEKDSDWMVAGDQELRSLIAEAYKAINHLDPEGSKGLLLSAQRSILNAHYTSYEVINAIYHGIEKAGFQYGKILEPSAGIGNFLAAMPVNMANNSEVTAIEKDHLSAMILQKLYPTALTVGNGYENINLPEGSQDLILSNIPFGDVRLYDKRLQENTDNRYAKAAGNLHNYFFAKSILMAKPGGLIAFITSRYTLDAETNQDIRNLMNDTCQFLGAIRLPDNAFSANAGTSVVSDIIFLKKLQAGETSTTSPKFLNVTSKAFTDEKGTTGIISYNEYYHNHPDNLLGKIQFGGLYRKEEFNLTQTKEQTENIEAQIEAITDKFFVLPVYQQKGNHYPTSITQSETEYFVLPKQYDIIGNIIVIDGKVPAVITDRYHIDEELDAKVRSLGIVPHTLRQPVEKIPFEAKETLTKAGINLEDFQYRIAERLKISYDKTKKLIHIQGLREKTKELIYKESTGYGDHSLDVLRSDLKNTYLNFVRRYGNLLSKENQKLIKLDTDRFLIGSLEKKDAVTGKISQADILNKRTLFPEQQIHRTDDVREAVAQSLQKYGRINTNYVAEIMEKPLETLMEENNQSDAPYIFIDENGKYLPREEYLSGNVVEKLKTAREALTTNPAFEINVRELEKNQPLFIDASEIYSPLHARWIPASMIEEFLKTNFKSDSFDLSYSESTDNYRYSGKESNSVLDGYDTKRKSGAWILNHALNGIEPKVTYTLEDDHGNKKTYFDAEDTQLAKNNYNKIRSEWDDWKFQNYERRKTIEDIYNKRFNNIVLRSYDGSKLSLPGLTGYTLRSHQKDCVFRNVQQFGGINDHMVGAGKTLIQIATAIELRRLGLANKPMIIGLKSQIPQLYEQFKRAYPLAKVLYPTEKDFQKSNRKHLLNSIATNDWDCIIISHDQFNMIQQPIDIQLQLINELKSVLEKEIAEATDKQHKKSLIKRLENYTAKLDRLLDAKKDKDILDFSKIGVDFLMVDESQEFKNLEFITAKHNIKGLGNPMGSKKAFNLFVACRYLQELHEGDKGIIFSSGTPISNTMAELYLLMKYLRPSKLQSQGLDTFDKWAGVYANDYSDLEYYMGRFKEVHRFREFVNLPELIKTYREIADVRNDNNLLLPRPTAEHNLIKIQPTAEQISFIEKLQKFIDTKGNDYATELGLTAGYDYKKKVNPSYALLAINFAKRLSLDPRLIDSSYTPGAKLKAAAENIFDIYQKTSLFKGTQLVFSDMGTPKSFNTVDNFYEHLNGEVSESDLKDIFGENYYEKTTKPSLAEVTTKASEILNLSPEETGSLIKEANMASSFNAYDALKDLLTAKGIPENEIAFIHSYNTRKQKEELYDKTNRGEIRILLGSTKKLGTGVNVQNLIVAGHHLDISWRPADIDQRNGRFIRQGNMAAEKFLDNKIPAFYYATERTLDASMYNTVSQKAVFISQIKSSADITTRSVKDIEEDIDISSMAAELSGDPIFKERAKLTKSITELEMMEKAFNAKKFHTENKIKSSEKLIRLMGQRIEILNNNIPYLKNIRLNEKGEPVFSAKINGHTFDKIGDYGNAIIAETEHAKKYKPIDTAISLGQVWGFTVTGTLKLNYMTGQKVIERSILSPSGDIISQDKPLSSAEVSAGVQIKQDIWDLPKELLKYQGTLTKEKEDLLQYRSQFGENFPHKKEITKQKNRLLEVNEIITEKTREKKNENEQPAKENNEGQSQSVSEKQAEYKILKPIHKGKFARPRL